MAQIKQPKKKSQQASPEQAPKAQLPEEAPQGAQQPSVSNEDLSSAIEALDKEKPLESASVQPQQIDEYGPPIPAGGIIQAAQQDVLPDLDNADDIGPAFLQHREDSDVSSAMADLDSGGVSGQDSPVQVISPEQGAPQTEEGGFFSKAIGAAKDVARGITEAPRQIVGGVRDAVQETIDTVDSLGDWLETKLPMGGLAYDGEKGLRWLNSEEFNKWQQDNNLSDLPKLPEIKSADSATGGMIRGVAQFTTGFIGAGKALKPLGIGKLGANTQALIKGAAADFTVFDPEEKKLSDLIQKYPTLSNPVTEFLAGSPQDSELEKRTKRAIEGAGLGVAGNVFVDGFMKALGGLRAARIARAQQAATEGAGAAGSTTGKIVAGPDFSPIGDPKGNLFLTKVSRSADAVKEQTPQSAMAVSAKSSEQAIEINFARINEPEDIQKLMADMVSNRSAEINEARRGVRTWEQTKLSADQENAWKLLMSRRKGEPLNAEQSVAARQLWANSAEKLKEVSKLAAENPSEANLFSFRKMLATHYAIQKEVVAARTETARALNAWKIPTGSNAEMARQMEMLIESGGGSGVAQDLAKRISTLAEGGSARQLEKFVEGTLWAKTKDAVAQVWINSLLSNPTTHMANQVSNFSVALTQMLDRRNAAYLSKLFGTEGGVEAAEAMAMAHGMVEGIKDSFRAAAKSKGKNLLGESLPSEIGLASKLETRQGSLSSEVWNLSRDDNPTLVGALDFIDVATRTPGRMLGAGDEFWKTVGYRMELHARAARQASQDVASGTIKPEQLKARIQQIIENPPEDVKLASIDAALYQTFQKKPAVVANRFASAVQSVPVLGRILLPFKNTPINALTYTFEHTPLAPLVAEWRADLMAGGARADLALAKMGTGSAVLLTAIDFSLSGQVTGKSPKEAGARAQFLRAGKQEYSVKVGDKWVSYNRVEPIGMVLGLGADIASLMANIEDEDDDLESVIQATTLAIAKNVTSKTYLQGLTQFFDAMSDPDKYGESFFKKLSGSIVPSGVASITKQVDPYMRVSSNMIENLQSRVPFWSEGLPMYRDLWGRPVDFRSDMGMAYDLISPIRIKKENPEPVDQELARIGFFPQMPSKQISYNGVVLDLKNKPALYQRYVELAGNEQKSLAFNLGAKDYLNAVISGQHQMSQVYRLLSDGPEGGKADFIKRTLQDFKMQAVNKLIEESAELRVMYEKKRKNMGSKLAPEVLGLPAE